MLRGLERSDSPERLAEFYGAYDRHAIDEATYRGHLEALEDAFTTLERRLADGRRWLVGEAFTVADVIWSLKVLRLRECGYPFGRNLPYSRPDTDASPRAPASGAG